MQFPNQFSFLDLGLSRIKFQDVIGTIQTSHNSNTCMIEYNRSLAVANICMMHRISKKEIHASSGVTFIKSFNKNYHSYYNAYEPFIWFSSDQNSAHLDPWR